MNGGQQRGTVRMAPILHKYGLFETARQKLDSEALILWKVIKNSLSLILSLSFPPFPEPFPALSPSL